MRRGARGGTGRTREEPREVLTAGEAALLRLDEAAVVEAAESGRLPGRLIGGDWRFSREALMEWLAPPPPPPALSES